MSRLAAAALSFATDPSPAPTEIELRPGLEEWQVSPGLVGFLVTFALAVACVLLFLNMSRHLRRTRHNAERAGLPVPQQEVIGFRRDGTVGPVPAGETDGPGRAQRTDGDEGGTDAPAPEPSASPSGSDTGGSSDGGSSDSGGGGGD
ncbi:MAG TPA: hypothetical protein VKY86_11720 [Promicromonospora sp.]|nr:hypothetical protein [Promicromonospora sp.]